MGTVQGVGPPPRHMPNHQRMQRSAEAHPWAQIRRLLTGKREVGLVAERTFREYVGERTKLPVREQDRRSGSSRPARKSVVYIASSAAEWRGRADPDAKSQQSSLEMFRRQRSLLRGFLVGHTIEGGIQ